MSEEARAYDLVVVGGGPAGIVAAVTAIAAGRSVALVDSQRGLGGAGVNTGTIPSKALRETALALSGMRSRELYGVDLSLRREATVADFVRHEQSVKSAFNALIEDQLEAAKALVLRGFGKFIDAHTLAVHSPAADGARPEPKIIRGEKFLIATGSSPTRPPGFPFESPQVFDSDTILDLRKLPHSLVVIGAGAVGCEYACTFATLETKVHVIDGRETLLPFLDGEVSRVLTHAMERLGIELHWGARADGCRIEGDQAIVDLGSGKSLTVDAVLVCAGRTSNTQGLDLQVTGVEVGKRGRLVVDEHTLCTNVPHIYAAGDVTGPPALASMSMEQGRRAVRHALLGEVSTSRPELMPSGIYTIPEASMVGLTEEALREQKVDYVVGRALYRSDARGRIIGDPDGFLKLLFRAADMRLLGVHVLGEQATELVHIGLMAMLSNATADIFHQACFNFPTLAGLYKTASFDAALRAGKTSALATTPTQF